jgi:hypothetical protein
MTPQEDAFYMEMMNHCSIMAEKGENPQELMMGLLMKLAVEAENMSNLLTWNPQCPLTATITAKRYKGKAVVYMVKIWNSPALTNWVKLHVGLIDKRGKICSRNGITEASTYEEVTIQARDIFLDMATEMEEFGEFS